MAWYIVDGTLMQTSRPPACGIPEEIEWDAESITLSSRVRSIDTAAFNRCMFMRHILLPDSLTTICDRAFWACAELEELHIPEGVTHIGEEAFAWCAQIKEISLPRSLRRLGAGAFKGCSRLRSIRIAPDHPYLRLENGLLISRTGELLRADAALIEAIVPEGVLHIADSAFAGCEQLERLRLPRSLREIGRWAFSGCRQLTHISLPPHVRSIGAWAFEHCHGLTEALLPPELTMLDENAFFGCSSLRTLALSGTLIRTLNRNTLENLSTLCCLGTPEEAPGALRSLLCASFAEREVLYSQAQRAEHIALIRKHALRLCRAAFDHPALLHLMCREHLISARHADAFMEEALRRGDVELTALLLEYQSRVLTMPVLTQTRERRERIRERQDDTVFQRAAARMDRQGIRELNFAAAGKLNRFENREALRRFLCARGARLSASVTSRTDFLITGHAAPDAPAVLRAQELGVEIITEDEFDAMTREIAPGRT